MEFHETEIPGAFLVRPQRHADERGFFARTFCVRELTEHGLDPRVVQCSLSSNLRRGTLRGSERGRAREDRTPDLKTGAPSANAPARKESSPREPSAISGGDRLVPARNLR